MPWSTGSRRGQGLKFALDARRFHLRNAYGSDRRSIGSRPASRTGIAVKNRSAPGPRKGGTSPRPASASLEQVADSRSASGSPGGRRYGAARPSARSAPLPQARRTSARGRAHSGEAVVALGLGRPTTSRCRRNPVDLAVCARSRRDGEGPSFPFLAYRHLFARRSTMQRCRVRRDRRRSRPAGARRKRTHGDWDPTAGEPNWVASRG